MNDRFNSMMSTNQSNDVVDDAHMVDFSGIINKKNKSKKRQQVNQRMQLNGEDQGGSTKVLDFDQLEKKIL